MPSNVDEAWDELAPCCSAWHGVEDGWRLEFAGLGTATLGSTEAWGRTGPRMIEVVLGELERFCSTWRGAEAGCSSTAVTGGTARPVPLLDDAIDGDASIRDGITGDGTVLDAPDGAEARAGLEKVDPGSLDSVELAVVRSGASEMGGLVNGAACRHCLRCSPRSLSLRCLEGDLWF